jgi:hypothetical protein
MPEVKEEQIVLGKNIFIPLLSEESARKRRGNKSL